MLIDPGEVTWIRDARFQAGDARGYRHLGSAPDETDRPARRRWLGIAIVTGMAYFAVAIGSSALAGAAGSDRVQFFCRLSAFVISGVLFVAHLVYEHFRLRNTARRTASHASLGVALGAFALALAANIHDLGSPTGYRPRMLIALVVCRF